MLVSRVPKTKLVQEMQKHPRVAVHRAGHVAQDHERRMAPLGRAALQGDDLAAVSQARAQARAQVHARPVKIGLKPPRADLGDRQPQIRDQLLRLRQLFAGHRLEVGVLKHFAR